MSRDLVLVVTTQKQPVPVTFGHQNVAILADKSTVPEWYPGTPTLPLLSTRSAGGPYPGKKVKLFWQMRHMTSFSASGVGVLLSQ